MPTARLRVKKQKKQNESKPHKRHGGLPYTDYRDLRSTAYSLTQMTRANINYTRITFVLYSHTVTCYSDFGTFKLIMIWRVYDNVLAQKFPQRSQYQSWVIMLTTEDFGSQTTLPKVCATTL